MSSDILQDGLSLMFFGMLTVALFLTVLVWATGMMSSMIQRYFPEVERIMPEKPSRTVQATGIPDPHTLAVIEQAIKQHRKGS